MTQAAALAPPEGALALARASIATHSKSFALASRVLPPASRDPVAVLYAWCRRADDAVDLAPPGGAGPALARLRAELDDAYAGRAVDPVLAAMGALCTARAIPRAYPEALLDGMAMDVDEVRYERLDQLHLYGWRVAGVVGLMMSHVLGVSDDRALVPAAQLGLAMQLTNIARDVAEDWERGRLYLPDELLARHGLAGLADRLGRPLPADAVEPLRGAVAELLARAEPHYRAADAGVLALPWRAAFAVTAARRIYAAIGGRLAARRHDVTAGRAATSTARKLALVARAAAATLGTAPRRAILRLRGRRPRVPTLLLEHHDVPPL